MDIFQKLYKQYGFSTDPNYGQVIAVPERNFKEEWDDMVLQGGGECHGRYNQIYVVPPKSFIPEPKTKQKPPQKESKQTRKYSPRTSGRKGWRHNENKLLIEIANNSTIKMRDVPKVYLQNIVDKDGELKPGFFKRTESSIKNRVNRLQKQGLVKKRFSHDGSTIPEKGKLIKHADGLEFITENEAMPKVLPKTKPPKIAPLETPIPADGLEFITENEAMPKVLPKANPPKIAPLEKPTPLSNGEEMIVNWPSPLLEEDIRKKTELKKIEKKIEKSALLLLETLTPETLRHLQLNCGNDPKTRELLLTLYEHSIRFGTLFVGVSTKNIMVESNELCVGNQL